MNFYKLKFNIKKAIFDIRAKIILKLIGDMPVIVNCTIYDDVFEYNFGATRTYKPCIAYNNKIKRFEKYAKNYKSNTVVLNGGDL